MMFRRGGLLVARVLSRLAIDSTVQPSSAYRATEISALTLAAAGSAVVIAQSDLNRWRRFFTAAVDLFKLVKSMLYLF